ncbi:MAG: helix-turn-helix transcriptional regulator [Oscillospiraceae bacterium]|nr:helix-turn-helix transcriptional regulator [Oscillospiraceae bacterium]
MELGNKIRQLRYRAGLTQEQLADRLGVGAQAVSKWENSVAMPDISLLPAISETFGVSIDELFDLSSEQKLNRIENSLDIEDDLPNDQFREYEDFLRSQMTEEAHKQRAVDLMAYLYWHRMNAAAQKVRQYAKDSIRMAPSEKKSQWMLAQAERHYVWDWNISNHANAIDFYRELTESSPEAVLPYYYLIDNLLADHRADEAEKYLEILRGLDGASSVLCRIYPAHIALARFDEKTADSIIEGLVRDDPDDSGILFETAQYYAKKCDYDRAIELYELSYEKDTDRPRFVDALQGISDIYKIRRNYAKAAEVYGRIVDSCRNEWGMTEEAELRDAEKEHARLLALAQN